MAFELLGTTLIDDVAVPRTRLADLLEAVEAIGREHGLVIGVVGHAGDGNMHPTVVFDPADPVAAEHARLAFGEIMDAGLALGGTITGEHGVGVLKREWLSARPVRSGWTCTGPSRRPSTRSGSSTRARSSTWPDAPGLVRPRLITPVLG